MSAGIALANPDISYDKLHSLPLSEIPEKVHVTGLLTTHGNAAANGYVYLLDQMPGWEYSGKGKLSLSDEYSRAGAKSVRWDWKAGDVIRIKDAGIMSKVRVGFTGFSAKSEEIAPFALSIFKEAELPENTKLQIYFKRLTDHRSGENELKLTRMRYFMNFTGTWYKMGGVALNADTDLFGQGDYIEVIGKMPEGVAEPQPDEIVIQAPTDVESGTFYLDRLITLAEVPDQKTMDARAETDYLDLGFTGNGKLTDNRAWPFDLSVEADLATIGAIDEPIDPTKFDQADTGYFGARARKPAAPEMLGPAEQAYVDELRKSFFVVPPQLSSDDKEYLEIQEQAQTVLDRDCVPAGEGRYKFKETINFGGDRIYFDGDLCTSRKHIYNFPESLRAGNLRELDVKSRFLKFGRWYSQCPDSAPVEALFKAYLDWYRYQVSMPMLATLGGSDSAITGHFAKYGGSWLINDARKMIAVLRDQGTPEDLAYANYIGEIIVWMSKVQTYTFAVDPLPGISREWSAETTYFGMFYEPDDSKFFQMLTASQESFTRTFSISEYNRRGMIKPDYTFWHHGHCSYWGGNFYAHIQKAAQFADTPLDFSPTIRRTLAWYIPRYCFGAYNFPATVKGGQESTNGTLRFKHWAKERLNGGKGHALADGLDEPTKFSIDSFPRRDVFEYLYEQDWEEVPAAKKFMAGVLGMTTHHSPEVKKALIDEYPNLQDIAPQRDSFFSFNWSGAATYNRGMTRAQVGSYNDMDATPSRPHGRWSWNRGYGCLYLLDNDRVGSRPPLGADFEGYSWSKAPGITMPAVTDEEYIKHHTMDGKARSEHGVELNTSGGAGNGSVTFNETEEEFGRSGNYSFQTLKAENDKVWKNLFGIDGVAGRKSYHFSKDKIVCLGSDYEADTDRAMETILFQETLDPILWKGKNPGRWNPSQQVLVLNGESFSSDFQKEVSLERDNFLISPYGHAWVIPGEQEGKLKLDWKERETLFNYRLGINSVTPGQRMTEGTGVIAWLDHGVSREVSSHHYYVLLNSDGKSPEVLAKSVRETLENPEYRVLKHDRAAHAIVFEEQDEKPLYSYVIYQGNENLTLPFIAATNKRLNMMFQENGSGELVMSVSDPHVDIDSGKSSPNFDRSRSREISITFDAKLKVELVSARSGLPQTNPDPGAKIENNTLTYTTRNAVSDTFVFRIGL
ncbi:MAG: chondroitinase family protein [Akkermansiaceae bacterium]